MGTDLGHDPPYGQGLDQCAAVKVPQRAADGGAMAEQANQC
jgi:hypothetical protein